MRTKLLATMKSLISTAKSEGFTRREAMEALAAFCDTIEAAGVPSQLIAECVIETVVWTSRRIKRRAFARIFSLTHGGG